MLSRLVYRSIVGAASAVLPRVSRGGGKLARGVRGQADAHRALVRWAEGHRRPDLPLVWFHAPSVGEGLQARAVIEALRRRGEPLQIAYTHFSPSAERLAARLPVDFHGYIPFDRPGRMSAVLDAVRPDVVVFTKTEIWPALVAAAAERGVRTALLSATLPPDAGRMGALSRWILREAHATLDGVGAIADEDAERFVTLGVRQERIRVTGDARFDQVAARASAPPEELDGLLDRIRSGKEIVVVAGSTWPADEARLVPAAARLAAGGIPLRLVLVPHEPTEEHVAAVMARARGYAMPAARLSSLAGDGAVPDLLVVDRMGILGDLYGAATVGFVGGAFGGDGIHSVLEPAAFGVPILFGPFHENAREAKGLIAAGGARTVASALDVEAVVRRWHAGASVREEAGAASRAYVLARTGAAERGADLVRGLLKTAGP